MVLRTLKFCYFNMLIACAALMLSACESEQVTSQSTIAEVDEAVVENPASMSLWEPIFSHPMKQHLAHL